MSLASQIQTGFTRVGTEFKTLRASILAQNGLNSALTTTDKTTLVNAINEVKAGLAGAGAAINDTTPGTTTTYSSSKINTVAAAAAAALIADASATTATTTTYSANKINAVATAAASAASSALIADASATSATTTTYSANKINTAITAAITALINGAPTALDTLKEISDQLATDESAASALTTAVGNRLRFDAVQTLTSGQQTQGQANLVVYSQAQIGDPATDFSATFVTALS